MGMSIYGYLVYGIKVEGEDLMGLDFFDEDDECLHDTLYDLCKKHGCMYTELGYVGNDFCEATFIIHPKDACHSAYWNETISLDSIDFLEYNNIPVIKVCDELGLPDKVPYNFQWHIGCSCSC
jgi:hypothetical protein